MLSARSSVDIHALKRQGMTISEIARRTNHDRKTIRAYLNGERQPEMRERTMPDSFDAFVDYATARLTEDPHLWVVTLLYELRPLGRAVVHREWLADTQMHRVRRLEHRADLCDELVAIGRRDT